MPNFGFVYDQVRVTGKNLISKIGELIHAGNVRRIIIKDDSGKVFLEIPITVAVVGIAAAPLVAGLSAIAAMISHFTLVIEKVSDSSGSEGSSATGPQSPVSRVEHR